MSTQINSNNSLPLPPGSLGLPLIGETLSFIRDDDFEQKRLTKYGNIYKTNIFGRPTVMMVGADANQFLFKNENKYVRSTWPKSTRILLGSSSLSVQQGNLHSSRRKILSEAFKPRALASYIPTIESMTQDYLAKWEKMGQLTWYPELKNYTFDVASKLLMGVDQASETSLAKLFTVWLEGLFSIPISLPWMKFSKSLKARKGMLNGIEEIVLAKQKQENLGEDALSLLLKAKDDEGNSLSLEELKDQVLLLLFAGHETLTSALASFCMSMAQYPDILQKIREEQQKFDLPITMDKLKEMTYLDCVLKEVLRTIPPVGGGFREVIESFEFNGYLIPKGWIIQYQIGRTHQDKEIYSNSNTFNPDRFSPEKAEDKQKTFGYIPFGGGLRECLGKEFAKLEMKIFAALLARNYQWELLPQQNLAMDYLPSPHPKDGLQVKFSPIS